jgi:diguanylate cyclase (GGDEF)-like protein
LKGQDSMRGNHLIRIVRPRGRDGVGGLTSGGKLLARLDRRSRALQEAYRRLRRHALEQQSLAQTDPLTGLPNRRAIEAIAQAEVRRRVRYAGPLTIGLIDIDDFKAINSSLLLPGGDRALIGLAEALTASSRQTDHVGRIGGDEFLVVAPETNAAGAQALAERIRAEVSMADIGYHGQAIRLTVSIGLAVAEDGADAGYEQLLHLAASALRDAKEAGKDRYVMRLLHACRRPALTSHEGLTAASNP